MHRCFIDLKKTGSILDAILVQCCCVEQKTLSYRGLTGVVAWIEFLMSFPQKRESREYLSELYSKFLYNFTYFKCFFWIPAFAGMTYSTFLDPCNNTAAACNDVADTHTTMPRRNDISEARITS